MKGPALPGLFFSGAAMPMWGRWSVRQQGRCRRGPV